MLLLALLALVLGIRWLDPLSNSKPPLAVSEPIDRSLKVVPPPATIAPSSPASMFWPVRTAVEEHGVGNAFITRSEVAQLAVKRQPVVAPPPAPPPAPPYVPPPPPPPIEVAPPLQVIGTWGDVDNLAAFLSGPQGTVLAHPGDVLLRQYRVQSITKQQVTLLQSSNQRVWNIAIPTAPANLQSWPGR